MFRKNFKYFLIIIFLIIAIFALSRGADNSIKNFFFTVFSPFLKTFRIFSGGVSGFFDFLGSIGDLKKENESLVIENQRLVSQNNRLKDVEKENQILRQQLGLLPRKDFELEASFVIAQDPQGLGNYFLIDKGENAGVKTGMAVIVSNGILIGRINETYSDTSKVILITDPESAINAEVQESGAKGIVKGEYGLGLKMDMIPQSDILNEGDTVITSGLGGQTPRGLTIGKIGRVSQSADKLFQQASIVPAVEISALRVVFVVKR